MKRQNTNVIAPYVPATNRGDETVGSAYLEVTIQFLNPVNNSSNISTFECGTLNNGEATTNELIDNHIDRYKKVWEALA